MKTFIKNMEKEIYLSCILFKNDKGLLGRVATTLGQNDVNIESINISSVNKEETIQKVIIYTSGIKSERTLNEIIKSMSGVLNVTTFKNSDALIEKEVFLLKIKNINTGIIKIAKMLTELEGKSIFMNSSISVYEVISEKNKIDEITNKIFEITEDIEISRSPVVTKIN